VSGGNAREQEEILILSSPKTMSAPAKIKKQKKNKAKDEKNSTLGEAEVSEENARKQLEDEAMQELCRKGYYNIS
jgi:hypothetical protein